jgi:hypothetical protein
LVGERNAAAPVALRRVIHALDVIALHAQDPIGEIDMPPSAAQPAAPTNGSGHFNS